MPGLTGKNRRHEERAGQVLQNAKFAQEGKALHITTGPAVTYWNPANKAAGEYTVTATFNEPHYMNLNSHPHPYGIVIAGNDMGTAQQNYLYCAAYGNGSFIVRGFSPSAFQMNGGGEMNPAVHQAAGAGQPVTQQIAISRKGDGVEVRDQRHRRRELQKACGSDRRKTQIPRRRVWTSLRSQHRSCRNRLNDDEELIEALPLLAVRKRPSKNPPRRGGKLDVPSDVCEAFYALMAVCGRRGPGGFGAGHLAGIRRHRDWVRRWICPSQRRGSSRSSTCESFATCVPRGHDEDIRESSGAGGS